MTHKSFSQWRAERFPAAQSKQQRDIPTEIFRFPRSAKITPGTVRALMLTLNPAWVNPAWGTLTYSTKRTRRYFLVCVYDSPGMSAVLRQWLNATHD